MSETSKTEVFEFYYANSSQSQFYNSCDWLFMSLGLPPIRLSCTDRRHCSNLQSRARTRRHYCNIGGIPKVPSCTTSTVCTDDRPRHLRSFAPCCLRRRGGSCIPCRPSSTDVISDVRNDCSEIQQLDLTMRPCLWNVQFLSITI